MVESVASKSCSRKGLSKTMVDSVAVVLARSLANVLFPSLGARPLDDRPNFIVLFMDDLGYGDSGFAGHPTKRGIYMGSAKAPER
jgi:hypothetical protein